MKYEPVLRKPTEEEKKLFTPEFLESLFEKKETSKDKFFKGYKPMFYFKTTKE